MEFVSTQNHYPAEYLEAAGLWDLSTMYSW